MRKPYPWNTEDPNVVGYISHTEKEEITELLVGRKVTKVDEHTVELDDGTILEFPDTEGGCSCSAGCYDLTVLNGVDNIITNVKFYDSPMDDDGGGEGVYRIFVYAANEVINLASWEGTDGNGYYGTGYEIVVKAK